MSKPFVLNKAVIKAVLEVVDAGLTKGLGEPIPGNMCVEAAVCGASIRRFVA